MRFCNENGGFGFTQCPEIARMFRHKGGQNRGRTVDAFVHTVQTQEAWELGALEGFPFV